ncbi:esterase/lipase family protein [Rossellomorea marisflavi]|nr:hypothetical protein [Rossellomorea marisflavi]TYO72477.1 hypothetical protein DQ398_001338 [Rossellomorea marisflavi]USK94249.1 hypothetical protein LIT29_11140 [Rossellomorea marisflavi]
MKRKISYSCLFLMLLFPSWTLAGDFGKDDPSGNPGEWYVGTNPAAAKQPILFVHGLNSSSNTWWNENDMYDVAYRSGYKTAFIDLYPQKDMWANGALLAAKLKEIHDYFGGKVVVVAHSKGGIDTQSALVHYGADRYVSKVITLSSPHHGSQLADLAYSNWAGWLAAIIGSKNEATASLQTGYMSQFRSQTDGSSGMIPFYTMGGTSWGGFGGSLYWGGLYLSGYGSNDGAVTIASSRLPNAQEVAIGKWDHKTVKEGSSTFSIFQSLLSSSPTHDVGSRKESALKANTSSFIRGGEYTKHSKESFWVEVGAERINIDWLATNVIEDVYLTSPDGEVTELKPSGKDQGSYFNGAIHHVGTVENPIEGEWKVSSLSKKPGAYLLNVGFTSPLNDDLGVTTTEKGVSIQSNMISGVTQHTMFEFYPKGKTVSQSVKGIGAMLNAGEGTYNLTTDIESDYKGKPFNRTIIQSVYLNQNGQIVKQ